MPEPSVSFESAAARMLTLLPRPRSLLPVCGLRKPRLRPLVVSRSRLALKCSRGRCRPQRIPGLTVQIRKMKVVARQEGRRQRSPRTGGQAGFSLVELIVAFTILLILSAMAVPLARFQVRREREKELRADLREMRDAINKYKDVCDQGKIQAGDPETYCFPPTLEILVEGVKLTNTISGNGQTGKLKFLRRIPKDPMTGDTEWGKRSMQDEPTSSSWGGQNVFDVYSKTMDKAGDGTPYSEW